MHSEIELPPHKPAKRSSATATLEDLADWEDRQGYSSSGSTCLWNDTPYARGTIVRSEGRRYQCDGNYWVVLADD